MQGWRVLPGLPLTERKPYTPPVLEHLGPARLSPWPRPLATLDPMTEPPNPAGPKAAALELARALRELAQKPAAKIALRGLEAALPEASTLVREALSDPAGTLGEMVAPLAEAAAGELADADRTIAAGLARAFGRGVARGVKRGR
jgi:hypothetical protein